MFGLLSDYLGKVHSNNIESAKGKRSVNLQTAGVDNIECKLTSSW